jgi:PAS domain S-box-containing protein
MKLSLLGEWLRWIRSNSSDDACGDDSCQGRPFVPAKRLCERDNIIIDMLNSQGHSDVSFCVTDPHLPDNPVIYINGGFTKLTGYEHEEVEGRNCRFLQGEETSERDRQYISEAIKRERDCSVNLVNYKKDGTKFVNEVRFFYSQFCHSAHWIVAFARPQGAVAIFDNP